LEEKRGLCQVGGGQKHKRRMVEEGGRSCNKNGEGATVKKREKEADREICTE